LKNFLPILTKSILFRTIKPEDLREMLVCLQPKIHTYAKNDYIAFEGEDLPGIGIMLAGNGIIMKENAAGQRYIMGKLESGDIFGEMVVYATNSVWPATIQALENSTVMFLSREKIIGDCCKMCPWHRSLIENMLRIISEKALFLNKKLEYLTIRSMRGKISAYLLDQYKKNKQPVFTLPMKRHELADFLHVSRPSMSREMGKMRDEGIITFERSTIEILDKEKLKGMLES